MARAGVTVDTRIGVAMPGRLALARDETIITRHLYPQIMTSWGRLHHLSRSALPTESYHGGGRPAPRSPASRHGRTKAAGEALCLTDALIASSGAADRALADHAARREPFGRMTFAHGQKLGLVVDSGDGEASDDSYAKYGRDAYVLLRDQGKPPSWS